MADVADKLNMVVSINVQGKEGLDLSLRYSGVDLKTVLMVEQALVQALEGLLQGQISGK